MNRWFSFRLRSLLIVVAFVALVLTLGRWRTWPNRTLGEFDRLIAERRASAAEAIVVFEPEYRTSAEKVVHLLRQVQLGERTWSDLLFARQVYKPAHNVICWVQMGSKLEQVLLASVTVERGVIKCQWDRSLAEWYADQTH